MKWIIEIRNSQFFTQIDSISKNDYIYLQQIKKKIQKLSQEFICFLRLWLQSRVLQLVA